MFVVWHNSYSKLKDKQGKKKTSPKSYKTEIKILANPGLTNWALNNPAQENRLSLKNKCYTE